MVNSPPDPPVSADSPDPVQLDLRDLEPPQPMVKILAALESMEPGGRLLALLPRKPVYFLPHIEEANHSYTLHQRDEDTWELQITKGTGRE